MSVSLDARFSAVHLAFDAGHALARHSALLAWNEDAVEGSGLSVTKFKMVAFLISAFIAGLAGAVYIHYLRLNRAASVI